MLRKRYLTIHETKDAKASRMSILEPLVLDGMVRDIAYSVVKFIVNVKLVEKRAKRTVGKVIVEKVINHINIPGIPLAMTKIAWPSSPSHDAEGGFSGTVERAEA